MATYDAGVVTAYGAAVQGGYTGTYEDFCLQQAQYATLSADVTSIQGDIGDLTDLETTAKNDLVSAINEAAESGGEVASVNGQTGAVVLDAGDLEYDDEETYSSDTVGKAISDLKGDFAQTEQKVDAALPHDTVTGAIVTFSDGADNIPVNDLTVAIEPVQSGTGDPSPTNVRPISGWTQAKIYVQDTYDATADPTATIDLNGTIYGGTLDVTTGVLTVDMQYIDCTTITTWTVDKRAERFYKVMSELLAATSGGDVADGLICNRFKSISADQIYAKTEGVAVSTGSALQFHITGLTDDPNVTLAQINEYFTNNETIVVAKLATPTTVQLTANEVVTLLGQNNIWSDTGNTTVEYRADTKLYINKVLNA